MGKRLKKKRKEKVNRLLPTTHWTIIGRIMAVREGVSCVGSSCAPGRPGARLFFYISSFRAAGPSSSYCSTISFCLLFLFVGPPTGPRGFCLFHHHLLFQTCRFSYILFKYSISYYYFLPFQQPPTYCCLLFFFFTSKFRKVEEEEEEISKSAMGTGRRVAVIFWHRERVLCVETDG